MAGRSVLLVDDLMAGRDNDGGKIVIDRLRGGGSCLRCDYRIGSTWWACIVDVPAMMTDLIREQHYLLLPWRTNCRAIGGGVANCL